MNQTETNQNDLVQQLLEKYFEYRSPQPIPGSIREDKTTLQVQDDLADMCYVDVYDIATWMLHHKYVPTIELDGALAWEIYRVVVDLE